MNCIPRNHHHRLCGLLSLWLLLTGPAAATSVFVYHQADGSVLVTDQRVFKKDFRLVRQYRTTTAKPVSKHQSNAILMNNPPAPTPSSFDALIKKYAQQYRLDPALLKAVVQVESGFNPLATSKAGALGLMQLMPDTARRYRVTDSFDPAQNLSAGARYLRDLLDNFSDNINLSLAAYNAGFENVRRFRGIPPFAETLRYIRKVNTLRNLYRRKS